MELDVDTVVIKDCIEELEKIAFKDNDHGQRREISDDIEEFVEKMKEKYGNNEE